eukprot:1806720-Prymnesium_polylepis.2
MCQDVLKSFSMRVDEMCQGGHTGHMTAQDGEFCAFCQVGSSRTGVKVLRFNFRSARFGR